MIAHLYMGQLDGKKIELDQFDDERPEVLWLTDVENEEFMQQAEVEGTELSEDELIDLANLPYVLCEERFHPDGTCECLYEFCPDAMVDVEDVESDSTLDN